MFQLKNNDEIGAYFADLVKNKYGKSMRQFGRDYLEQIGEPTDNYSVDKMANRLAQIKKGEKGIQLTDLPVFTHLLGVTCEELLSAGEYIVPQADFMTVRQFAASHNCEDWECFVNRKDKAFLNTDEFGRNAIEYALEFKNYDLLKYLMNKGYIWFVDSDPENYSLNFGAGTSIKCRNPGTIDALDCSLRDPGKDCDSLRRKMICLAIENGDFSMLDRLKAREIPTFYGLHPIVRGTETETFYDAEMIRCIAKADGAVLDYFSQEFKVKERRGSEQVNTYIFPFIGKVAELLLEQKHPCTEAVLKRCAEHNRKFLHKLEQTISESVKREAALYKNENMKKYKPDDKKLYSQGLRAIYFMRNDSVISFLDPENGAKAITNLVKIEEENKNFQLAPQIDDINDSYNRILELQKESDRSE